MPAFGRIAKVGPSRDSTTVRTRIIEHRATTLEFPLLAKSGSFFFFFRLELGQKGSVFAVCSSPYLREGILDVLARGLIIGVLTVTKF